MIQMVAVFCGSKHGNDPVFVSDAHILGRLLAESGIDIIYGGGGKGIMGALANGHLEAGGNITGIIPKMLVDFEHQHNGLTELVVTKDMHTRKKIMYERCDLAIILPGGFGTLDELFEMLTWNQLSIHDKQILVLNSGGFYTHLMAHMRHLEDTGFLYDRVSERVKVFDNPIALMHILVGQDGNRSA